MRNFWQPHGSFTRLDPRRTLTIARDAEAKIDRAVDYRNLGAEELGSIYEGLLELHAEVDVAGRRFALGTAAGNERKTTGSYYTPTSLINELLDSALGPILDDAVRQVDPEQALLSVSVLDPACGSGHFLIAAANRIASRLASVRSGDAEPAPGDMRRALRDVVGSCVHGIDVNPMAVELCKVSLWLEATEPGRPLSFLDHRIVCGNALLGTTPKLLSDGIPDVAYKALGGDNKRVVSTDSKRNKAERQGQGVLGFHAPSIAETVKPLASAYRAIDAIPDDTAEQVARKAEQLNELHRSPETARARLAADAWCSAFVAPRTVQDPAITTAIVRQILDPDSDVPADVIPKIRRLGDEYGFLHPHLAFPGVFEVPGNLEHAENEAAGWNHGFDVVLGNPPWERVKLQEKEFFAEHDPVVAGTTNAAARKKMIAALANDNPPLFAAFESALRQSEAISHLLRCSGRYPLCGRGDINTYSVFAETIRNLISPTGRAGIVVPSGIATDDTTKVFFGDLVAHKSLVSLFDFENRSRIFPGIDSRLKFCLLTLTGISKPCSEAVFAFFLQAIDDLRDEQRVFMLSAQDFALFNPNTRNCPIFRTGRDMKIARKFYARAGILLREASESEPGSNPWGVKLSTMFHMTNDSELFKTREQLEIEGWHATANVYVRGDERYLPLYEAKLFHQYDHRYATFEGVSATDRDKGNPRTTRPEEKFDAASTILPRYWVPERDVLAKLDPNPPSIAEPNRTEPNLGRARRTRAYIALRSIARVTDERTGVAAMTSPRGLGNSASIIQIGFFSSEISPELPTSELCSSQLPGETR